MKRARVLRYLLTGREKSRTRVNRQGPRCYLNQYGELEHGVSGGMDQQTT